MASISLFKIIREVINSSKIICDNCGWSWNIVDGGDDLYICHKCNHDNTPQALENFKDSKEREIIDDILSGLNEGKLDGVLNKMKQYAKKGLLTLAVVASVTQGLQAQGSPQSDIDAINQQGIELTQQNNTVSRMTERLLIENLGQETFDSFVKLAKENGLMLGAAKSRSMSIARSQSRLTALSGINGQVSTKTVDSKTYRTSDGQYLVVQFLKVTVNENYADGKVKGKSKPGRVKKSGASCKGSVTDLRAKAKKYGGEKGKMYHWCANMKSGKK